MRMSGTGEHYAVRIACRLLWALGVGTKYAAIIVVGAAIVKSLLVIAEPLLLGLSPLHDVFYGEAHLDQSLQLLIQEALLHWLVHHKVWD